ncbi:MAG: RsiV family protein [Janthinobacterium lividum]
MSPVEGTSGLVLRYLQLTESDETKRYSFAADFVLVGSGSPRADGETNLLINAFITRQLQRFRFDVTNSEQVSFKASLLEQQMISWDHMDISHDVALFNSSILSVAFRLQFYFCGTAHPNSRTETLSFLLNPAMQLELSHLFNRHSNYLDVLSACCVEDLHRQQPQRWSDPLKRAQELKEHQDSWIMAGAGPEFRNFERFSFNRTGIVFHFDPYRVGSYAEGKYEVFVPAYKLSGVLSREATNALGWPRDGASDEG